VKTGIQGILTLVILIAGCGRKTGTPATGGETEEYQAWKGSQAIRQMAAAGPSESIAGTVRVNFPETRSKSPEDFIELRLNGQVVQRTRFKPAGGGRIGPFGVHVTLRPGVDWLDLWDSTTNRNYRFEVDSRQGTDFVFAPTAAGYDLSWTKRE
jgi:hypothetical protein